MLNKSIHRAAALVFASQAVFIGASAALAEATPLAPALLAARAGITPETLAIAGFSATEAGTILTRLQNLTPLREDFAESADATDEASRSFSSCAERLRRGACSQENVEAYSDAADAFSGGAADLETRLDFFFAVALNGFDIEAVELVALAGGQLGRRVPSEFLALERSDLQWRAIEEALVAERRAERLGQELPGGQATLLSDIRTDPAVMDAAANLAGALSEIRDRFAQYMETE